jgi:hypothetical protein
MFSTSNAQANIENSAIAFFWLQDVFAQNVESYKSSYLV